MTILYVIKLSNKEILKLQNCIEYILTKTEIRIVIESTYTENSRTKINKYIHLIKNTFNTNFARTEIKHS